MMIRRTTAVYYNACQLGSEIRENKPLWNNVFGANLRNIVPAKISTYSVLNTSGYGRYNPQQITKS